jgi:hypothetical protein
MENITVSLSRARAALAYYHRTLEPMAFSEAPHWGVGSSTCYAVLTRNILLVHSMD